MILKIHSNRYSIVFSPMIHLRNYSHICSLQLLSNSFFYLFIFPYSIYLYQIIIQIFIDCDSKNSFKSLFDCILPDDPPAQTFKCLFTA